MKCPVLGILVFLALGADVFAQDVDTTHGRVKGLRMPVLGKAVDVYYGIPFAKPPIGELRFKHPEPVEHWRPEVKEALAMKPSCQQPVSGSYFGMPLRAIPPLVSEDCLYLNIWVPANVPVGTKLATMVWIYGGSFTSGSINMPLYDGKYLAAENNVIVISVNYRVGALGFLYLGPDTLPGNQGMMDQVLALEWIYNNTERFGGDKNKITIFGESAGAASVGHHLLSPKSRDYFTRAILESGVPNAPWAADSADVSRSKTVNFAGTANCSVSSDFEMYDCIRKLPPGEILSAQSRTTSAAVAFAPVVDGFFLPDDPSMMLKNGDVKKTDILLGVNKDEGTMFLLAALPTVFPPSDQITVSRTQFLFATRIFSMSFGQSTAMTTALVAQYEATQVASLRKEYQDLADDILGDYTFKCPAVILANAYSQWSSVYLYSFERIIESLPFPSWMGVAHSFEIEVVFGHPLGNLTATPEEQELTRKVMAYWTNFAKTGNPQDPTVVVPEWPRYNTTDERFLVLDVSPRLRVEQGMRKQECVFVNTLLPLILENSQNPVQLSTTTERITFPCVSGGSMVKVTWMLLMMAPAFIYRLLA